MDPTESGEGRRRRKAFQDRIDFGIRSAGRAVCEKYAGQGTPEKELCIYNLPPYRKIDRKGL